MRSASKLLSILPCLVLLVVFLSGCGGGSTSTMTPGSGTTGGSGRSIPSYGEGTGSSGQTSAAHFLYVNPLPGGGPYAQAISPNGTLTGMTSGGGNNIDPRTMAIDPSGSFVFQVAEGYNGGTQGGIFVYPINRSTGSLGPAAGSYLTTQAFYTDVVDNQGKFLFVQGIQGIYVFSIQTGTGALTQIAGSPFAAVGPPSSPGFTQPATLMAVDQTNNFLYVSTTAGIAAFTINQTSGQLTPVAGSPFGASVSGGWTIVIAPNNRFLYEVQVQNSSVIHGYGIDPNTGVLTALSGSPFSAGPCGTTVPPGTTSVPGPDNMTIASAGKFMYDNCGIYSIDASSGALTVVSNQGPGDWPVVDPTGSFLWAITGDQQSCFSCDVGIQTYQVDSNTGALTVVPNGFLLLTNSQVGYIDSIAITK